MESGERPAGCHSPVITIRNLSFSYEQRPIIQNLNFEVLERDFVGLVGSNGAGKTTLLRTVVGLIKPDQGEIRLFGTPLEQFKDWERIGYVPQKNAFNPLFPATVREVVTSGLYGRKMMFRRLTNEHRKKCLESLEVMGITDLADRRIGQLSGGQQQRVFLARALVNSPSLLILDEPTVGIDTETQASFFSLLRHLHTRHSMTFLMVSHDIDMLQDYIGKEPAQKAGKLGFYVKHAHDAQNCGETSLIHTLKDYNERLVPVEG